MFSSKLLTLTDIWCWAGSEFCDPFLLKTALQNNTKKEKKKGSKIFSLKPKQWAESCYNILELYRGIVSDTLEMSWSEEANSNCTLSIYNMEIFAFIIRTYHHFIGCFTPYSTLVELQALLIQHKPGNRFIELENREETVEFAMEREFVFITHLFTVPVSSMPVLSPFSIPLLISLFLLCPLHLSFLLFSLCSSCGWSVQL